MTVAIRYGVQQYTPGAIGRVTEMHAAFYSRNNGFGIFFEARVATELSELLLRFDPERDGFWTAEIGGSIIGSVAIDGGEAGTKGARLRFLIVVPEFQGRGIGGHLLRSAVDFCRDKGLKKIYLTTIEGLEPARRLYEKSGFRLVHQQTGSHWGKPEAEQIFELALD